MKTFLISGAAGGLGGQLVAAALKAGHNVLATDLDPDRISGPDEHRDRLRVRAADVTSNAPVVRRSYGGTFGVLAVGVLAYAVLQSLVSPVLPTIQHSLHTSQNTVTSSGKDRR